MSLFHTVSPLGRCVLLGPMMYPKYPKCLLDLPLWLRREEGKKKETAGILRTFLHRPSVGGSFLAGSLSAMFIAIISTGHDFHCYSYPHLSTQVPRHDDPPASHRQSSSSHSLVLGHYVLSFICLHSCIYAPPSTPFPTVSPLLTFFYLQYLHPGQLSADVRGPGHPSRLFGNCIVQAIRFGFYAFNRAFSSGPFHLSQNCSNPGTSYQKQTLVSSQERKSRVRFSCGVHRVSLPFFGRQNIMNNALSRMI